MKKIIVGKSYLTFFVKNKNNETETIQITIGSDKTRMLLDIEQCYEVKPKFLSEITIAGDPDEIFTVEKAVLESLTRFENTVAFFSSGTADN